MDLKILIAADDLHQQRYLSAILSSLGYDTVSVSGGLDAVEQISIARRKGISLALLDLHMPDIDGIKVLKQVRTAGVTLPILVLTSDGSIARAVDAMRAGANDFLVKPAAPERLDVSIRNALAISDLSREVKRLNRQFENRFSFEDLISVSQVTREAIALAKRVACSGMPVLIQGESGTGKEVFARAIHGSSERSGSALAARPCIARSTTCSWTNTAHNRRSGKSRLRAVQPGNIPRADR